MQIFLLFYLFTLTLYIQNSQLIPVQLCEQLHALAVQVDMPLQLLVDAVYLYVVSQGGYLALLQRLPEERKRLLQQLHVAVVYHLLQALQLLVAGAQ